MRGKQFSCLSKHCSRQNLLLWFVEDDSFHKPGNTLLVHYLPGGTDLLYKFFRFSPHKDCFWSPTVILSINYESKFLFADNITWNWIECLFTNWVVMVLNPVAVTELSDIVLVSSKDFFDIQGTTECRITLNEYVINTQSFKIFPLYLGYCKNRF